MLLKEFCAENFTFIPRAIAAGAKRIELCDNLNEGGTSVSLGVLEETLAYCQPKKVDVMVMIRPRSGDFIYNDHEVKIMARDIEIAKEKGATGVVFGCLNESNWLDEEALQVLIKAAEGLQTTFHMAFDELSIDDQFRAIGWLARHGVQRILTHGGPKGTMIEQNLEYLHDLIAYANQRITILPGGGITSKNAERVAGILKLNEVHGTKIVDTQF